MRNINTTPVTIYKDDMGFYPAGKLMQISCESKVVKDETLSIIRQQVGSCGPTVSSGDIVPKYTPSSIDVKKVETADGKFIWIALADGNGLVDACNACKCNP